MFFLNYLTFLAIVASAFSVDTRNKTQQLFTDAVKEYGEAYKVFVYGILKFLAIQKFPLSTTYKTWLIENLDRKTEQLISFLNKTYLKCYNISDQLSNELVDVVANESRLQSEMRANDMKMANNSILLNETEKLLAVSQDAVNKAKASEAKAKADLEGAEKSYKDAMDCKGRKKRDIVRDIVLRRFFGDVGKAVIDVGIAVKNTVCRPFMIPAMENAQAAIVASTKLLVERQKHLTALENNKTEILKSKESLQKNHNKLFSDKTNLDGVLKNMRALRHSAAVMSLAFKDLTDQLEKFLSRNKVLDKYVENMLDEKYLIRPFTEVVDILIKFDTGSYDKKFFEIAKRDMNTFLKILKEKLTQFKL